MNQMPPYTPPVPSDRIFVPATAALRAVLLDFWDQVTDS